MENVVPNLHNYNNNNNNSSPQYHNNAWYNEIDDGSSVNVSMASHVSYHSRPPRLPAPPIIIHPSIPTDPRLPKKKLFKPKKPPITRYNYKFKHGLTPPYRSKRTIQPQQNRSFTTSPNIRSNIPSTSTRNGSNIRRINQQNDLFTIDETPPRNNTNNHIITTTPHSSALQSKAEIDTDEEKDNTNHLNSNVNQHSNYVEHPPIRSSISTIPPTPPEQQPQDTDTDNNDSDMEIDTADDDDDPEPDIHLNCPRTQ